MIVPTPEDLPDLAGLGPNLLRMALRRFFQSAGPPDQKTYALSMNAIRLGDLCVREYQSAREAIVRWHTERKGSGLTYVALASGHFEACLWATERLLKHVKALRAAVFAHAALKAILPKDLLLLRGDQEKMLVDTRDALAHLERCILRGELPQGSSLCLTANGDDLEIGSLRIPIRCLAEWIRQLHGCTTRLADYAGESAAPSGDESDCPA